MTTPVPGVDLRPDHWAIVRNALRCHVPDREVVAFGSRATWTAKDYSDLDLAVMGEEPLSLRTASALDEALGDSELPFKVDVVDWARIDDGFRRIIRRHGVAVQAPALRADAPAPLGQTPATGHARSGDRRWARQPLGHVIELKRGYDLPARKRVAGSVPVVSSSGVTGNHRETKVRGPGVVTGRYGTLGKVYFITDDFWPLNTTLYVRDFKGNDPRFVSYLLCGLDFSGHSDKAAVPGLNRNHMHEELVRIPTDVGEQRAIAGVLGMLDDKIELNRRMTGTLEAMARALFRSWFVDFDPVRAKMEGRDTGLSDDLADLFPDRLVDSEMGEIPEGWEVATLAERIEVNPRRPLRKGQAAPYLPMANMPTRGHMPDAVAVRPFGSGMRFANGDTLVARITPCLENGKTAYVDFLADGEIGWGSTEYIVLRPRPPLPNQFAYCLARSAGFREFAIQNMSGTSGRQRVPPTAVRGFSMVVPPRQLAALFGEVAEPLFERAGNGGRESRTLAALRDTLLPKLISGEIRVLTTDPGPAL